MISFDTNVIIRLMVEDDEAQARESRRVLDNAVERGERVLVTDIVLCEVEWVLDSAYRVPRSRILTAVQALCEDERFCFQDPGRVNEALDRYQQGRGDLSDYLLGISARDTGAGTTYTFDRSLSGEERFTIIA
jgi:predicted nucleic-acid-binding protein